MPKKLWVASVEIEMLVVAETPDEAQRVAARYVDEDFSNSRPTAGDFSISTVDPKMPYLANFEKTDLPWGTENDKTAGQYLEEMLASSSEEKT